LERAAVFAEEDFVVEAQTFLHSLMEEKGFSRADLARAMGVSRARVTQIFSDECKNFTVRLLARAVHALGEIPIMALKHARESQTFPPEWRGSMVFADDLQTIWDMKDMFSEVRMQLPCNDQAPARLIGYDFSQKEWEAA
jgi:transcriptional regulator with XRE-family HTH domain